MASFIVVAILAAGCGKSTGLKDTPPEIKLYSVKSAKIEYEYSGDSKGTKTQYFANYGMYQSENDNFTLILGESKQEIHTLTIKCDSVQYSIDMKSKEGVQAPNASSQLAEIIKNFTKEQRENINAEILMQAGAKKTGTESILGKDCDVYEWTGSMKLALWKGIIMKSEMRMGAYKMNLTAKNIETDIDLDIARFTPPKDVKITTPEVQKSLPPGHPPVDQSQGSNQ